MAIPPGKFVSRAGFKLDHALEAFQVDVQSKTCADFGSNTGGFVDCLLQHGAVKVFAIDTGYGALEWNLRNDPRVVVMERTNAIHVELPQRVQLLTIDVAWTRQRIILPTALRVLGPSGDVITLIKPHYEADAKLLRKGVLPSGRVQEIIDSVRKDIVDSGFDLINLTPSPIKGSKGNAEVLAHLRPPPKPSLG
jgi:23S rRNA (cytidine1920-2'-O)/16S rRNA (cytidine1409-2'-O)-methyltransferase